MKKKPSKPPRSRQSSTLSRPGGRRRSALKGLLAGGAAMGATAAVPGHWVRPVVQSVVLPAHAQTSPGDIPDGSFFSSSIVTRSPGLLEYLVPSANAAIATCTIEYGCARVVDGEFTLFLVFSDSEDTGCYRSESGQLGETVDLSLDQADAPTECDIPSIQILRLEGDAPARTLVLSDGSGEVSLIETPGDCDCGEVPL